MPIELIEGKEVEVGADGKPVAPVESAPSPAPVEPAPTVPAPSEPAVAPMEPDRTVPLPALLDERHKRQDIERDLNEANQRLQEFERLQREVWQRQRVEPINYGAMESYEDLGKALESRNQFEFAEIKTALSKEIARLRYTDFDEVLSESGVLTELERNPALAQYLAAQPMPAIAAYQIGLARVAPKRVAAAKAAGEAAGAKKVAEQVVKAAEAPVTLANAPSAAAPAPTGLTLDKAAEMSESEWAALSPDVRERLLRGERI